MKRKIVVVALVAFAGIFIVIAFKVTSKTPQKPKEPSTDRLKWHVAEAKREGRQKVAISTGMSTYLGSENASLESAFSDYTVVVAKPITKRTYQRDGNSLRTWYKFQIQEPLTQLKNPPCLGCFSLTPPSDLLPLGSNEFLVPRDGGRFVLDGVEIDQAEPGFPEFEDNQQYLLFIALYPNQVALPAGGPMGVFAISQNHSLISFNKDRDTIQDGIKAQFNSSLDLVRKRLRKL